MKTFAFIAATLALAGCQKSVDQQFNEMCAEQKSDPEAPRIGEEECASTENVGEQTKSLVVDMYHKQRDRLHGGS